MIRLRIAKAKAKRRAVLCILLGAAVVCGGLIAGGCSRATEDPAWFQSRDTGAPLSPEDLLDKISRVGCLFRLHDMKREFILRSGDPGADVLEALDARRDQLVEKADAFPAIPGALDFLGWRIRPDSEVPGREWADNRGKYEISGYFFVTGEMDRDWQFKIMTKVDEQHTSSLPPDRQKAGYLNWPIYPRTSTWELGGHHILSTIVDLRPIPYYIYAHMFLWPEGTGQAMFRYGWFADPDLPPIPEDKPAPN